MSFHLRQYQHDITDQTRALFRQGIKSVLIQLPTGGGKTLLTASMLNTAATKGFDSWFIVHRRELVKQTIQAFSDIGIKRFGVISSGFQEAKGFPIQICSIQTLIRRHDRFRAPNFIAWDECISGDSLLTTDKGIIRIDDVPRYGATSILSYNGDKILWQKITAWRLTGIKKTKRITLLNGESIRATENHLIFTKRGWIPTSEITIGDQILYLKDQKDNSSSEHCLGTHQLDCQTKEANRHGYHQITPLRSMTGVFIKLPCFIVLTLVLKLLITQDTDVNSLEWSLLVCLVLTASILYAVLKERRLSQASGSIQLAQEGLLGGTVMMEHYPKEDLVLCQQDSIRKDLGRLAQKLFENGLIKILERRTYTPIKRNISLFLCLLKQPKNYYQGSNLTFQSVCSIKLEKEEKVYDISVDKTHCFFANGLLVHNCHHVTAGSWSKIFKAYAKSFHVGLTATPQRLDGAGLRPPFMEMVNGPSMSKLIEEGFLVPYKLYAPSQISVSGVHTQMGDFQKAELARVADRPAITGDAIKHYQRLAAGKRAVVFCVSVEHSKHVVGQFNQAGIVAAHVDGETPVEERDMAIRRFRDGEIKVLSNVELFGEGFDLPALEVAILLRPTQSLGLYLQQVGRALRPSPGKQYAIILDHAGNCERHGLPDEDREWSLDGRDVRRGAGGGISVKVCPRCFAAQAPGSEKCKYCGKEFEVAGRSIEEREGTLVEVDPAVLRRQKAIAQGRCETVEELIAEGKRRGYKHAERWAHHVFKARQSRKFMSK